MEEPKKKANDIFKSIDEMLKVNKEELVHRVARFTLPIVYWIEGFIKPYIIYNPKVDPEYAKRIVMKLYDNEVLLFKDMNFFTEKIFFLDLELRELLGRIWWIDIFGEAGTGKSIWGLLLFLKYDDDAMYWRQLLKRQVTADSAVFQEYVSQYSKFHDAYKVLYELCESRRWSFVDEATWYRKFKAWLESSSRLHMAVGSQKVYYEGMKEMELATHFSAAISYWEDLGYISRDRGKFEITAKKKFPRKVFILDEALKKYGAGSLIMSDSLKNMIKVSRVKNINFVFCGVVQEKRLPFTYILKSEEGMHDFYDPKRLLVLKAGVHYPVTYGNEGGYDRIGTAVTFAPPDEIIQEYLSIEREVMASAEIGGLGFTDFARMKLMSKFNQLQSITELIDVEEVVDLLEKDEDFKFLQNRGRMTWNRIKPIVARIVSEVYETQLTALLWERIRFEIEKRGLK